MNENVKWVAAAVAVVGLSVGGVLYFSRGKKAEPVPQADVLPPPAPVAEEPAVKHPIPDSDMAQALPGLNDSNASMQDALGKLVGKIAVEQYVVPDDLVRHIVVSIDNLPEQKVAERVRPVKRVPGEFKTGGSEDALTLDPANFQRYDTLIQLVKTVDTQQLAVLYKNHYPLFQEAYADLGHPPQYFNDRMVEVIDHLLQTPDVQGPIALAQPGVLYTYADPGLEALSAGQKVLLRMGTENAKVVKAKLRELRAAVIAQPSPPPNP